MEKQPYHKLLLNEYKSSFTLLNSAFQIAKGKSERFKLTRHCLSITAVQSNKKVNWRQWLKVGPGIFVAVGYIDPGNWVTDIAGGSCAGYALLSVVLISSLIAMLLQIMSARLGIATGKDLAQLSKETWPRLAWILWIAAELAMIATDIAEVIGAAIALQLLFSIPIILGVVLTVFDVLLLLTVYKKNSTFLKRIITLFLFIISCGFVYEIVLAQPIIRDVVLGFIPSIEIVKDKQLLYLAIGVIGATIMPHNLYLHSNLVIDRWANNDKRKAASYATVDTILLLSGAMILNSALIIFAASVFHAGNINVAEISDVYRMLPKLLGTSFASFIFAAMLLVSGQSATITSTLAGQVVTNGFIRFPLKLWCRRLLTRSMSLLIALAVISYCREYAVAKLLIGSQVLLSLQLPLAMIPLLLLTSNKKHMGMLVNGACMRQFGCISVIVILIANGFLILSFFRQ